MFVDSSFISFKDSSTTDFTNNNARHYESALFNCLSISFEDSSTTDFTSNTVEHGGGAIFNALDSSISFEGNSTTVFINNTATRERCYILCR